uniref:Uncharacterized protein n=1 Tax=viral metagenome TaxID=1070528 RepID=A0A6C0BQK8_9ZZZZ
MSPIFLGILLYFIGVAAVIGITFAFGEGLRSTGDKPGKNTGNNGNSDNTTTGNTGTNGNSDKTTTGNTGTNGNTETTETNGNQGTPNTIVFEGVQYSGWADFQERFFDQNVCYSTSTLELGGELGGQWVAAECKAGGGTLEMQIYDYVPQTRELMLNGEPVAQVFQDIANETLQWDFYISPDDGGTSTRYLPNDRGAYDIQGRGILDPSALGTLLMPLSCVAE